MSDSLNLSKTFHRLHFSLHSVRLRNFSRRSEGCPCPQSVGSSGLYDLFRVLLGSHYWSLPLTHPLDAQDGCTRPAHRSYFLSPWLLILQKPSVVTWHRSSSKTAILRRPAGFASMLCSNSLEKVCLGRSLFWDYNLLSKGSA